MVGNIPPLLFLINKKNLKNDKSTNIINTQIAEALMVHLTGDEEKPEKPIDTEGLGLWGKFIYSVRGDLIKGWYSDLKPPDNQITIDLRSGSVL